MTTVNRVYNFSSGPAVLPVPVLEEIQRDLMALPDVGMSILEISHRSAAFESILAQAEADVRALAGIPSNYKVLFLQGGASTQFSMVPMNLLTAGRDRRLHRLRIVGRQGHQGSEEGRHRQRRGVDQGRELLAHADAGGAEADAGRRLRAHDLEQHDRGHRVQDAARGRRRAARQRHLVGHVQPSARRRQARADLRRRAEEPRTVRRHAGHHPRGSARPLAEVAADDAELRGAGGERIDVQHAADLCGLHARSGDEVADRAGRPRGDRRRSTSARPRSCTPKSIAPASIAAPPTRTAAR